MSNKMNIQPKTLINMPSVLQIVNKNRRSQEEVKAMGLSRCNIICMRSAGNKSINNAKYVGKM